MKKVENGATAAWMNGAYGNAGVRRGKGGGVFLIQLSRIGGRVRHGRTCAGRSPRLRGGYYFPNPGLCRLLAQIHFSSSTAARARVVTPVIRNQAPASSGAVWKRRCMKGA